MKRFQGVISWLSAFIFAVAVIAVYKTFDNFDSIWSFFRTIIDILNPFVVGFGIAFILFAPSRWIENKLGGVSNKYLRRFARPIAIFCVYLALLLIIGLILFFALPALGRGVVSFVRALPGYFNTAVEWLEQFTRPGGLLENVDISGKLQELYNTILSKINAETITASLQGLLNLTSSLLNVFMSFIISIYMLASRESLFRALRAVCGLFMKEKWIDNFSKYAHKAGEIFYKYLYSALIDAVLIGIIVSIGLVIFGVPNGVLLGMIVGLMNMIPYFGALIGGAGCALIALLSNNIYTAIGVAIYILVMQQIDGNIIQPRIIGGGIGIRPIYVLLAITVGGGFFGFWGILLGVPFMAVIQLLLSDYIAYRNRLKVEPASAEAPPPPKDSDSDQ